MLVFSQQLKHMKIMKKRNEFQKTVQCFQMDQLGQNKGRESRVGAGETENK